MFKNGYLLTSNDYLEFAKKNNIVVTVWKQGILVEIGPIDLFTEQIVNVNNQEFLRTQCEFKVQEVVF